MLIEKDEGTAARRRVPFRLFLSNGTAPDTGALNDAMILAVNSLTTISTNSTCREVHAAQGMYALELTQSECSVLGIHALYHTVGDFAQHVANICIVNSNPYSTASNGNYLKPTVAGRTLDVTATGGAGIDWANVENPTTAVNLSGTSTKGFANFSHWSGTFSALTTRGIQNWSNLSGTVDISVATITNLANHSLGTVAKLTGHTPQTGDNFARLGAPAGASIAADIAAVKVDTAAILVDTGTAGVVIAADQSIGTVTNLANHSLGTVAKLTGHTAQTGDNFARLGAPTGASVSADIAAVKSDSAAILDDTGTSGVVIAANQSIATITNLGNHSVGTVTNVADKVNYFLAAQGSGKTTFADLNDIDGSAVTIHSGGIANTAFQAGAIDAAAAATDFGQEMADRILSRNLATGADGTRTVQDALRGLRNKTTLSSTSFIVYEEDDATVAWHGSLTTTGASNFPTEVDPA